MIEPATHQAGTGYSERLWTPWWWYPVGALVGVLLGAEFAFIIPAWLTWLPIVLSILVALLLVWRLGSATIQVRDGQLLAGDRALPLTRVGQAIDLTPTELRRVVGRHGDPLAHNFIRSWVGPGLQLVLTDRAESDDRIPEPYWLISTRHPDRVIAAIDAALPGPTSPSED